MFKRVLFLGISSGILAAIVSVIYSRIHFFATYADFSRIINPGSIIGANLIVGIVAAIAYWLMKKWFKQKAQIIFNFAFSIISFASIMISFAFILPLDIQFPELFPGLTVPMHFFPALAWYTLHPLFITYPGKELKTEKPVVSDSTGPTSRMILQKV